MVSESVSECVSQGVRVGELIFFTYSIVFYDIWPF